MVFQNKKLSQSDYCQRNNDLVISADYLLLSLAYLIASSNILEIEMTLTSGCQSGHNYESFIKAPSSSSEQWTELWW